MVQNGCKKVSSSYIVQFVAEIVCLLVRLMAYVNYALSRLFPTIYITVIGLDQQSSTVALKSELWKFNCRATVD